jgi:peptidyl-prolyl cis-trans isomerase SurA
MTNDVRTLIPGVRRSLILVLALAGLTVACGSKPSATTASASAWAVVNGHEISRDDVEKAFRRSDQGAQTLADDDAFTAKMTLLDDLITQDILLAKARELKIELPDADVEKAFTEGRKNIPEADFEQALAKRNLTATDMREALRRDMLVQKLLTREVTDKVAVTDQEVSAFYTANTAQFNRTEDAYHVLQIVLTPTRDEQITNRTGSDATTPRDLVAKLQMIKEKLQSGAQFSEVAADYSEDAATAPRGGDLGFLPVSAIQKYPPQLRDAVLSAEPGKAKIMGGSTGFVIVLVAGKDPAGQKTLDTPGVKDAINRALKTRREQLLRAAFVTSLRNAATVDNLIVKRVVEAQGKVPTL